MVEALEIAVEAGILEEKDVTLKNISGFMGGRGRAFYGLKSSNARFELIKGWEKVMDMLKNEYGSLQFVPLRRGEKTRTLTWLP